MEGTDSNGCMNYSSVTQNVSLCTVIEELDMTDQHLISVFPNPAQSNIDIRSVSDGIITIQITDVLGKTLFFDELLNKKNAINIEHYVNGFYIIKASNKKETQIIKLVKQ